MKYRLTLGIGFAGAKHEEVIDVEEMTLMTKDDWEELTPEEKDCVLEDIWRDWSQNYIDGGWEEISS